ncbi:MAG: hypothetical protein HYU66_03250, partial [Armatimonadetes bacterium]|nr:hypothetical protein [Armatimonadota bacterium]
MADRNARPVRMPTGWSEPHPAANQRVMVSAVVTFAVTVVLVIFVDYSAFTATRDDLAAEFAEEHQLISLYAATHLRDLYQMGVYGLIDLA